MNLIKATAVGIRSVLSYTCMLNIFYPQKNDPKDEKVNSFPSDKTKKVQTSL
jgi:hypothetical protein